MRTGRDVPALEQVPFDGQGQAQRILLAWLGAFGNLPQGDLELGFSSSMAVPWLVWCWSHPAFRQKPTGAE